MKDISKQTAEMCEQFHISYCANMNNGTYAMFDGYEHHARCSKHCFDRISKKLRNMDIKDIFEDRSGIVK